MNEISGKQLSVMIFFIPFVFKMSMLPAYLYETAGVDGYIIVGIFAAVEFIQLWAVLFACEKGGMEALRKKCGDVVYFVVSCPLLFVIFIKSILFVTEIVNYVSTFLFYNIIDAPIVITLLLICYYFAYKGARTVARVFETTIWLLPVIVVAGLAFGETDLHGDSLLFVFPNGGSDILRSAAKYLIYTFDFSPLLFCKIKIKKKGRIGLFSLLSVAVLMGCYMIFYCRYGRASFLIDCAFARLASFDTVISEVGSLDWISSILWITTAVLNLSLKLNAVAEIGTGLKVKRPVSIGTFCVALGLVLLKAFVNMREVFLMVTSGIQYAVFGIEIAVPIVLLSLLAAKKGGTYAPKS